MDLFLFNAERKLRIKFKEQDVQLLVITNDRGIRLIENEALFDMQSPFIVFHKSNMIAEIIIVKKSFESQDVEIIQLNEGNNILINDVEYVFGVDYVDLNQEKLFRLLKNLESLPDYLNFEKICKTYNSNFGVQDISEIMAEIDIPEMHK